MTRSNEWHEGYDDYCPSADYPWGESLEFQSGWNQAERDEYGDF